MTSREATLVVWGVLGVAVVVFEVSAAYGDRIPSLEAVVGRLASQRPVFAALILGWMWLGWHAFAR
jgi:hypothetical protein